MITNNNIKDIWTKLHGMYVQCYDILKAMSQSLSTKDSQISLVVTSPTGERETIRIPSFLYLENKLEQIDSSLASIIDLPQSGEAWVQNNSDLYKIEMVKNGIAPQKPEIVSDNIVARLKDNNFLKDLVSPKTYLKLDLDNMPNMVDSAIMKKVIIYNQEMYSMLNGLKSYDDIKSALYSYSKSVDYDEYESKLDIPTKRERFESRFDIISIPSSEDGTNPWTEYSTSKLSYKVKLSGLEYHDSEDSTITYSIKEGDCLCMDNQSTVWKVKNVNYSSMEVIIEEVSGHTALQPIEENEKMHFSIYSKDYSEYHYIEVPLEENQYIIVFLASVHNNTRSNWSTPLFCDLSTVYVKDNGDNFIKDAFGNNLTYIDYYKKYCTNIGDLILGITQTAYPQVSNFTVGQLERMQDSDEVQNAVSSTFDTENILQVIPINKHLGDDPSNEDIKGLHATKNDFMQQISSKQLQINEVYNKLISTDFSQETTITQSALKQQLDGLYVEKTQLQTQLNSIVDEISIKSASLDITGNEVKYRIRGVTETKYLDKIIKSIGDGFDVELIGCEVEYKYKSSNKNNNSLSSINSSTFTDWNRLANVDRQRRLNLSSGVGIEFVDYASTDNIIKWNQIDIPIQQGEDVVIRIRYKLNVGQPFINIYTPWSDEKTVVFPSQYKSDVDLTTILSQNEDDSVTSAFTKTLINDGYSEHIQDKIVSSDQKFFHTPENIYSGFNTPENKMISLKDKLNTLNNDVEEWKTILATNTNSKFEAYLNYDDYSILLSPNSKNVVNIYNNEHLSNIFVKKNMNIVIKNTGNTRLNLYSIFPGSTSTPLINCDLDNYSVNISNYERVPMIVNNEPSAQYLGQWIYFRENSAWTGIPMYYSASSQNTLDETRIYNSASLKYEDYPKNYMNYDNRQVLLGYRSRIGSTHTSTINESSVKWKTIDFANLRGISDIDFDDVFKYGMPSIDEISLGSTQKNVKSIYSEFAKTNFDWYLYTNNDSNRWLMRYEDIVKSTNDSSVKIHLTNTTTFTDFMTGGSVIEFANSDMFVGGFLYPELMSLQSVLTDGKDKSSKYLEIGESVSIPVVFEYYTTETNSSVTKTLCFDIKNSLVSDPIHYMIEVTGNYDFTTSSIASQDSVSDYTDQVESVI